MVRERDLIEVDVSRLTGNGTSLEDPLNEVALDCRTGTTGEEMARARGRRLWSQLITFQKVVPEAVVSVITDGGFVWIFRRKICRGETKR